MAISRETGGGPEPVRPQPIVRIAGTQEERRSEGSELMAVGTLACPGCDLPVAPAPGPRPLSAAMHCPYCYRSGAVRDFLTLGGPARPARVEVRVRVPRGLRPR